MASSWIAEKMGDMVEDAVRNALGMEDKDEDKDDKGGGIFSKIFDRDNDEAKMKKLREREKDNDKEGFFSKIFDRDDDDDDKKKEKKSGFSGLFSELEGVNAAGGCEEGSVGGGQEGGGIKGQTVAVNDGDLLDDLMDVAAETSKGK